MAPGSEPSASSGIFTFLFTDLESSTQLWQQHPETMKYALARHDALLRSAVESSNGQVVKTTGDGLMAVFTSGLEGVSASLKAQQSLLDEPWGETGPLKVRMGLHVGEAQPREGDYYGTAVNRAARLMSAAHGGQVLLSGDLASLLEELLPPEVTLRDLGEHQLKDLKRAEHVFQLLHPALEADFPSIATQSEKDATPQLPEWIPLTKLVPPQIGEDILPRTHLHDRLVREVKQKRLTLISAPAGSGKTVTAASLGGAFGESPLAWLALDEEDDYPVTFMWLLTAALKRSFPASSANAMTVLADLQNPAAELKRVMGVLINDVVSSNLPAFAFVIDDYHLIKDPGIHETMAYLLDRLPPPWHVVLATRRDPPLPLARLRARGQLAAFELADLHFHTADVQALFEERLSLSLPSETIETLQARTEGWIAGLRLLASTLQSIENDEHRRVFIEQFSVTDRHVFDLLAEEVLDRQAAVLRAFLLETSILRELTPELCRAVTGREDASRLLAEAVRRNLFLSTVGEFETTISPVYRYHDLFAEFLRYRLTQERPERIKELHRRAAAAETTSARVVGHYLAAEEWERAALAIEEYGPEMLTEGQVLRLKGWILAVPESLREGRSWLNYLLGMCYGEGGDFVTAQPYLQAALKQFRDEASESGETAALVALAYHAIGRHDFEQAADLLKQILERPLSAYESVRAHINHAWLMLYRNNWAQVDADTAKAMHIALSSEDHGAINVLAHQLTTPLILGEQGIEPIEHYHQTVLAGIGEGLSVVRAGALAVLSQIQWLRGDLEKGVENARASRELSRQLGGLVWMDMGWDMVLLADALIQADYATFERRWRGRVPVYEVTAARQWLVLYLYFQGRALWMHERWDDLHELARRASVTEIDFEPPESIIARQMFAALLSLHEGGYKQAETILLEAAAVQQRFRAVRVFFDVRFLLAHLYLAWGRPEDALGVLQPLLTTLAQQGAPGFILQEGRYVAPLLRLAVEHDVVPAFAEQALRLFDLH
jgi:ATP/maltotriose-dependent transcriptional regulator MalT/class 3 adenylate cyclase